MSLVVFGTYLNYAVEHLSGHPVLKKKFISFIY
jgi:hypothetical protein